MGSVDWSAFTWDAFATLAAGVMALAAGTGAIIGAIIVGKRQAAILKEQTGIQAQQALIAARALDIEELKVRTELFRDRFEVYQATRKWLEFIAMYARLPGSRVGDGNAAVDGEQDINAAFYEQLDRARFLFRPSVYVLLCEVADRGQSARSNHRRAMGAKDELTHQRFAEAGDADLDALMVTMGGLSAIFGDELNLSIHGSVHGGVVDADPASDTELPLQAPAGG